MAGFTVDLPQHVQASAPGTLMAGANVRVKGQLGFAGTSTDTLLFADGATGFWTAPNVRTRINGVFAVSQSSVGTGVKPGTPPVPVPVLVVNGDPRIRSL